MVGEKTQLLSFSQDPAQGLPRPGASLLLERKDGEVERWREGGWRMEGKKAGERDGKQAELIVYLCPLL